jgi:sugar phosphate isomerase/epimerase
MKAGISTYTYPLATARAVSSPVDWLLKLIDVASIHRLCAVQIGDNLPLETLTDGQLKFVAAYAAENRISLQTGMRGLRLPETRRHLQIARVLGSPFLRVVIDEPDYQPSSDTIDGLLQELLPDLAESPVILAIENHDRLPAATLRALIEKAASPWIGICLDTANSLGGGEGIREVLSELAPFTVNLHVKDISIHRIGSGMGFQVEGAIAGEGIIPIPEIIRQLDAYGRCHTATIEWWSPSTEDKEQALKNEQEAAEKSIRYIKKYTT